MKKFIQKALSLLFLLVVANAFSQTQNYIRKAEAAVYKGKYYKAQNYYLKALEKEPENYKANFGAGLIMAEYIGNYENSLPYLEKALKLSPPNDTAPEILFLLGKVYAFFKQYNNAISYFEKVKRIENLGDEAFEIDLNKRIRDCNYAKSHPDNISSTPKMYVVNAGATINTAMDEYVPVVTLDDKIIFTSKRKDGPKEKVNPDNGKYYEAMYVVNLKNGRTSHASLFSNISKKSINDNESIISVFPDGKRIFIYKDKKLYEGSVDRAIKTTNKLVDVANLNDYQNHACMSKDGNSLYFTSESESGNGGNDIYVALKEADGSWGEPKNLGKLINTNRDEEAPYISPDGKTLYFSSNGYYDCYGEFDIYKSTFENGMWTMPVNLGAPINSSGNDVFYVLNNDESAAYFSSTRPGGAGELDIYKVNFLDKANYDCGSDVLAIDASPNKEDSFKYYLATAVPDNMRNKIISYNVSINDSVITEKTDDINYHFKKPGDYKLKAKLVAWCDTCINVYVACAEKTISILDTTTHIFASTNTNSSNNNTNPNNVNTNNNNNTNTNINTNTNTNNNNTTSTNTNTNNTTSANTNTNTNTNANTSVAANNNVVKEDPIKGELSVDELNKIGIELKPLYFSFEDDKLRDDAKANLDYNIEILKKYPNLKIVVNGHTDSRGGKNLNLYLSERRAMVVRDYLIKAGVPRRKITISAKGEAYLINNCDDNTPCDNALHQLNRRVELKVVK